ncbi:glycoside hydrolase [Xylariaceae sp. AK1471]|nr:glycoside hydrolase [Xylariaceae sp. AK1471]
MFATKATIIVALLLNFGSGILAQDYSCGPGKPCPLGCCGINNVCGLGPGYCAPGNCTSECTAKSDCDPGWGPAWSSAEKCPLNVCCSKFGFCGTTEEFCGDKKVKKPSCKGTSSNQRTIGYYEGWSTTRQCDGMYPENIPVGAYTHLNYAFALIDPVSFAVAPMSETDKDLWPRFTALKEDNPGLKTFISVGGWSMNDPDQPTAATFSTVAGSTDAQNKFFKSLITFMSTYGFDGVDIDWEYPVAEERSGKEADYRNYVTFLKNLKTAFAASGHSYGITITIPSSYWYLRHFDIVEINKVIDWFNVMTYDLHGTWDSTIDSLGPKAMAHTNLTEIDLTMDLMWRNNIPPEKVVLGLGFYGRSFTLSNPSCKTAGCLFSGGGAAGECTNSVGTLSFVEINRIIDAGADVTLDKNAGVKIVTWDNDQWVSYDDAETFKMKLDYANKLCLGGSMVWAASTDDSIGTAASALSKTTGRIALSLKATDKSADIFSQCIWGACAKSGQTKCDGGLSAAQYASGKGKGNAGFYNDCPSGQERPYCCPKNDVPTCQWRGHGINCSNEKCEEGEVEITTNVGGCFAGHTRLCCSRTSSDSAIGTCKWEGASPACAAPFHNYGCDEDDREELTYSNYGAGGENYCYTGYKSMCCTKPVVFEGCQWYSNSHWYKPWTCDAGCPSGKMALATDPTHCSQGAQYFCCNNPVKIPDKPDVKLDFCYSTEGDFVEASEKDDAAEDSDDYLELWWYENKCFSIPNKDDPSVQKRTNERFKDIDITSLHRSQIAHLIREDGQVFEVPLADPWVQDLLKLSAAASRKVSKHVNHNSTLEERNGSRFSKICRPDKTVINTFNTSPYPGVGVLSPSRLVFNLGTSGICFGATLITTSHQQLAGGLKTVVEHVTELQTPKAFMNNLLAKVLPSGATGFNLRYDVEKVFSKNGYFEYTLKALGIDRDFQGVDGNTKISTLFYKFLGSTDFLDNLQLLTAKENSLKAAIWGLYTNINADKKWNKMSPTTKLDILWRLKTVVDYLNKPEVQQSLKITLDRMRAVFEAMDRVLPNFINVGSGLTLQGALNNWYRDHFASMSANLVAYVLRRVPDMITFWQSTQGQNLHGATSAAVIVAALQDLQQNAATQLAIGTGFM